MASSAVTASHSSWSASSASSDTTQSPKFYRTHNFTNFHPGNFPKGDASAFIKVCGKGCSLTMFEPIGPLFTIKANSIHFHFVPPRHGHINLDREVFFAFKNVNIADKARDMISKISQVLCVYTCPVSALVFCKSTSHFNIPVQPALLGETFMTTTPGQIIVKAKLISNVMDVAENSNNPFYSHADARKKAAADIEDFASCYSSVKFFSLLACDAGKETTTACIELVEHVHADTMVNASRSAPNGMSVGAYNIWITHRSPVVDEELLSAAAEYYSERKSWWASPAASEFDALSSFYDVGHDHDSNSKSRFARMTGSAAPGNAIDMNEVLSGLQTRTTVMLKNIPARMTHEMLKDFLDFMVFGGYDFLYLRMDFSTGNNVGYAFINFAHIEYFIWFVECITGFRWPSNDKTAEVSYATNQGRENLIARFRNSSVMQEIESFRPKLYYTAGTDIPGVEEDFPTADNLIKLARSTQNAAEIGLYTPSRNGRHRQHRIRGGRFDRGTSFALTEFNYPPPRGPLASNGFGFRRLGY